MRLKQNHQANWNHQVSSNPLPIHGANKLSSVGLPTRVEIRIVAEGGKDAAVGSIGEVWIRGATVTTGFLHTSRTVTLGGDQTRHLQKISVGPHLLQADELSDVGGNDAGPNAYELLLAALGACTGTTLRMYADRKQWPLHTVHVELSNRKIPIEEGEESGAESGMVDRIDVGVSVTGNLSEEQRRGLLEIAEKSPVHRTLVSEIQIQTRLTEPR